MSKFQLENCIAYLAKQNANELASILENRLKPIGISRVKWMALYFIEKTANITQKDLATCMGTSEPSIVRLLDRLEKDELVERVQVKENRRTHYLKLTKKGKKINEKGIVIAEKFKDETIHGIPQKDLDTFQKVLDKMIENTR